MINKTNKMTLWIKALNELWIILWKTPLFLWICSKLFKNINFINNLPKNTLFD